MCCKAAKSIRGSSGGMCASRARNICPALAGTKFHAHKSTWKRESVLVVTGNLFVGTWLSKHSFVFLSSPPMTARMSSTDGSPGVNLRATCTKRCRPIWFSSCGLVPAAKQRILVVKVFPQNCLGSTADFHHQHPLFLHTHPISGHSEHKPNCGGLCEVTLANTSWLHEQGGGDAPDKSKVCFHLSARQLRDPVWCLWHKGVPKCAHADSLLCNFNPQHLKHAWTTSFCSVSASELEQNHQLGRSEVLYKRWCYWKTTFPKYHLNLQCPEEGAPELNKN